MFFSCTSPVKYVSDIVAAAIPESITYGQALPVDLDYWLAHDEREVIDPDIDVNGYMISLTPYEIELNIPPVFVSRIESRTWLVDNLQAGTWNIEIHAANGTILSSVEVLGSS